MANPVLDILIKATLLLVLALVVRIVRRRAAAATRHLIWALALGGILVLPIAERIGPAWHVVPVTRAAVPLPALNATLIPASGTAVRSGNVAAPAMREIAGGERTQVAAATPPSSAWPLGQLLLAVWLAGVALVLAAYVVARAQVARLARRAVPVTAPEWLGLRDVLAAQLELDRPVTLVTLAGQAMPMTWGTWRPVILLPADADQWSETRRHDVLLHELAHVERRDCLTHLMAVCTTAVYWFHPLVWLAARGLRIERERACDDRVIAGGARPSEYAEHLLEIAHAFAARPATAFASLAMARASHLATRLLDVLDAQRRRDALTRRLALPGAIATAFLVLPVAALRPANPPPAVVTGVHAPVASPLLGDEDFRAPARRLSQPAAAIPDTGDCEKSRKSSTSELSHNHIVTLMVQVGRCVEELRATAPFKLNGDFTDIAEIDDDGSVTVDQSGGGVDHRVELRAKGATITRRWFVDNTERPYDAAAGEWFTTTLTDLIRRTGYQAEERSKWILKTRGVEGMFQEIAAVDGDYTKRIYYQALVADGKAEPAVVSRVVTQAGNELTSSYDLAELLVLVGRLYPLTEPMRSAFVAASNHLDSDYDRHRVLSVVLANRNLPDDLASAILTSAGGITSDYDLAEVLVVLIQRHPITDGMREAFFKAVNHIGSDYDRHRVLATVLAQQPPAGPALVADALASVGKISSSYDRAEVLVEVAGAYPLSEPLRTPFFAATDGIDSDYDHARVLTALIDQAKLSDPVIASVIASTRKIGSSSNQADVLVALLQHNRLSAALRQAYVEAAKGIDSDYDKDRALAALGGSEL
jgi:beta-lactamase regulating signal transducer with metallopeptidase domain